jgi:hypothetical protein
VSTVVEAKAPKLAVLLTPGKDKEKETMITDGQAKKVLQEHDEEFSKALKLFNDLKCHAFVASTFEELKDETHITGTASSQYVIPSLILPSFLFHSSIVPPSYPSLFILLLQFSDFSVLQSRLLPVLSFLTPSGTYKRCYRTLYS